MRTSQVDIQEQAGHGTGSRQAGRQAGRKTGKQAGRQAPVQQVRRSALSTHERRVLLQRVSVEEIHVVIVLLSRLP